MIDRCDMLREGDRVKCNLPGSWVDQKVGTILKLHTVSSDMVYGHLLKMPEGVTVVEPEYLELVT